MINHTGCKEVELGALKQHPKNRNKHSKDQIDRLCKILEYQGWRYPIKVSNRSGFITSGHGRLMAARQMKLEKAPVSYQDYDSEEQEYADVQSDNAIAAWAELDLPGINLDLADLGPDFDIDLLGIEGFNLDPSLSEEEKEKLTMVGKFGAPPFSILDARQGYWQERKRYWLSLGIQSEIGRGGGR